MCVDLYRLAELRLSVCLVGWWGIVVIAIVIAMCTSSSPASPCADADTGRFLSLLPSFFPSSLLPFLLPFFPSFFPLLSREPCTLLAARRAARCLSRPRVSIPQACQTRRPETSAACGEGVARCAFFTGLVPCRRACRWLRRTSNSSGLSCRAVSCRAVHQAEAHESFPCFFSPLDASFTPHSRPSSRSDCNSTGSSQTGTCSHSHSRADTASSTASAATGTCCAATRQPTRTQT